MRTSPVFSGKRLRLYRELRDLSLQRFGSALHERDVWLARSTLRSYEGGHTEPRATVLAAMADVLQVDVMELYERQPTNPSAR
jgi:transcriptional regulator with XRE-family HTH domain